MALSPVRGLFGYNRDNNNNPIGEEEKIEITFTEDVPEPASSLSLSANSVQAIGQSSSPQYHRSRPGQNSTTSVVSGNASSTQPVSSTADTAIAGNLTKASKAAILPSSAPTSAQPPPSQARKVYRFKNNKWVTREIAALDFLLGIPLVAEEKIVNEGILQQLKQEQEMDASDNDDLNTATRNQQGSSLGPDFMNVPRHVVIAAAAPRSKGRWWEKWLDPSSRANAAAGGESSQIIPSLDETELELPVPSESRAFMVKPSEDDRKANMNPVVPGRRLEGDEAVRVQVPLTTKTLTKQRTIARAAQLREWELQTAHGLKHTSATMPVGMAKPNADKETSASSQQQHPPMLDGRLFFSASGSYPLSVFSLIRYEPKKEEMQRRRQKLEARGGGGTQFIMPARDWRGISYRALLPRKHYRHHDSPYMEEATQAFNRFLHNNNETAEGNQHIKNDGDDTDSVSSHSSDDSDDVYEPGVLDDPAMVLGRHRHVMIGDRSSGPIVSSTIQFVRPSLLKSELNKQFRERFDGWEPPREARKYIGAKVVDGAYVLMDPTEDDFGEDNSSKKGAKRSRQGSVTSSSSVASGDAPSAVVAKELRIPPSLTLSKIRSLKQQALAAAIEANLEIGTVALSCVYFERLCLDCRVDKSNRRLVFATCLLLASKLNEPNVGLVMQSDGKTSGDGVASRFQSLVRPNKRSSNIFASLLEFFTEKWNLSLKHLFGAEWGVFAALGFSLHAKPSQVAFHFKRLMKTKGWNPRNYLGEEMHDQWQLELEKEEERRRERELRRDRARRQKEMKLLNIGIEMENERRMAEKRGVKSTDSDNGVNMLATQSAAENTDAENTDVEKDGTRSPRKGGIRLLNRFGMRRIGSRNNIFDQLSSVGSEHRRSTSRSRRRKAAPISTSPSMPVLPSSETTLTTSTGGQGVVAEPTLASFPASSSDNLEERNINPIVSIGLPRGDGEQADEASSIGSISSAKGIVV